MQVKQEKASTDESKTVQSYEDDTAIKWEAIPSETQFKSAVDVVDTSKLSAAALAALLDTADDHAQVKNSKSTYQEGFESIEHVVIGDTAFKKFCEQLKDPTMKTSLASAIPLALSSNIKLTPGQIVALAGDFFGVVKEPICFGSDDEEGSSQTDEKAESSKEVTTSKRQRFYNAYRQLAEADSAEMEKILSRIKGDRKALIEGIKKGERPSVVLENRATGSNFKYDYITRYTLFPIPFLYSRYSDLAQNNFDHFGQEAIAVYSVGHQLALETAAAANRLPDLRDKTKELVKALTFELFACHFLTDLFSAGHIRTPRKRIFEYVRDKTKTVNKLAIAGLLAKEMHDEDSRKGLSVYSINQEEPWTAMGDDCYFDSENDDNSEQIIAAVIAGLNDIYNAYRDKPKQTSALDYIPKLAANNFPPLFDVDKEGDLVVRTDVNDKNCRKYQKNWSPIGVLLQRKFTRGKDYVPTSARSSDELELEKEYEKLAAEKDTSKFKCTIC